MEDLFDMIHNMTCISRYSNSEVVTPKWVVSDMVDLLPADVFEPNSKFLDPAVKSGRFLVELHNRLMTSDAMKQAFPNEQDRHEHIIYNQLYGIALSETAAIIARRQLYDDFTIAGNVVYTGGKFTKELVQGVFSTMKFDVVIGNPPYNNDMYLDFVTLGCQLSTKYTVMITPAKWQAKDSQKNNYFREHIAPYMSKIVYYPDATDIFDIAEVDGVCYYIIGNRYDDKRQIINKSNKTAAYNNETIRDVSGQLNNAAYEIIARVMQENIGRLKVHTGNSHFGFKAGEQKLVSLSGDIYILSNGEVTGTCNIDCIRKNKQDISKYKVMLNQMVGYSFFYGDDGMTIGMNRVYILKPNEVAGYNYFCIRACESLAEAESVRSFINTKLIRFIVLTSLTTSSIGNEEAWRFVPDPGAFDHIFTDDELYNTYGLTPEEIKIIESVIKERK